MAPEGSRETVVQSHFPNGLTVVVPVLNEVKRIKSLVAHLNALPCKIIVVDGGSADGTCAALRADAGPNVQVTGSPAGRARQMNAGAAQADTPFLLFLHADTTLPKRGVTLVLESLCSGRSPWGRFDVCFDRSGTIYSVIACCMNWRSALTGICTGDQAIFVTADVFAEVRGFDDIPLMEDIELSRKLKQFGKPIRLTATVTTAARRWQANGPVRTVLTMWRLRFLYWLGASPQSLARRYVDAR